jgi:hypothetical protein
LNYIGGRKTQAAQEQRRQDKFFLQQHRQTVTQEKAFDKQRRWPVSRLYEKVPLRTL